MYLITEIYNALNQSIKMAKKMIKREKLLEVYHCDIFRFCDRWCEKCEHTTNCFFYNLITFNNDKEINIDKKALEYLLKSHRTSFLESNKKGVKIHPPSLENLVNNCVPSNHSFNSVLYAEKYSADVNFWFSSLLDCDVDDNVKRYSDASCFRTPMKELKKSIELIRRYQDLISSKLDRAISNQYKGNEVYEKGYAKLAIVLIEDSIKAWMKLYNICTANKERSLKIIKHLETLLKEVKLTFPGASSYYRVGHD